MSADTDVDDPEQTSFVELVAELERLNANLNGAFAKVSQLSEQVESLERRVSTLESHVEMQKLEESGLDEHRPENRR